ncbi:transposase [Streptomyces spinoverrucosus]|uniref:Transposase n=1 Tax=Streptomyces spinoverrucosus TaxID=284043 RepID=A0A4Y3VWQ8_9ACTN|nr:integrase core domain-containing protein [Streptomyces spinoverrucosus]GEC10658.1 transposase [Streptomyces spinoverrucosus]GHB99192.1 transposase [Streptomyces spinoverrucosus]
MQDAELTEQITAVHAQSRGTYGAPRIHAVLRREGTILREFRPENATDARWCGDITSPPTRAGSTWPPSSTSPPGAWSAGPPPTTRTELVPTLCEPPAADVAPPGRSDRGCQYTSREFALFAAELDIHLSVGRTGQCWDNALAESFFATLKNELLGDRSWPSRSVARTAVFEWIEGWYNLHRLHSSLGYRSPADYEAALAA